ncbi:MAG: hypothetical protein H7293_16955 [Candidatus Saccharibacteria bacterium]|nr:hypothetical protein [Rhodoferax sp.]
MRICQPRRPGSRPRVLGRLKCFYGNSLQPPHSATQVQMPNGKRVIHDGPYADTEEHLGGWYRAWPGLAQDV